MPYETVQQKVVQTQKIRVCANCRCELPDVVQNRKTINQVGSAGGSLATSIGASMLVGSVLGPVGAIGGCIAGAVIGARAGQQATDKVCDIVEHTNPNNYYCESCKPKHQQQQQQQQEEEKSSSAVQRGAGGPPDVVAEMGDKMQKGLSWVKDKAASIGKKPQTTTTATTSAAPATNV